MLHPEYENRLSTCHAQQQQHGSRENVNPQGICLNSTAAEQLLTPTKRALSSLTCSPVKTPPPASPLSAHLSPQKPSGGDRFIPSRLGSKWTTQFYFNQGDAASPVDGKKNRGELSASAENGNKDQLTYMCLVRNEVLGMDVSDVRICAPPAPQVLTGSAASSSAHNQPSTPTSSQNNQGKRRALGTIDPPRLYSFRAQRNLLEPTSPYSSSPLSARSQALLRSPRKAARKISKMPFKVLDAPELQDDFYLNLVDWSSQNVLAVGLGASVWLWFACTSQVTRLCDLSVESDSVTSVAWTEKGNLVAVGTHHGLVQIWDVTANKRVNTIHGHTARVGALAWNGDSQICSGSRDRYIQQKDIRAPPLVPERRLQGHRQEVCGLRWSPDNVHLASGGNDNKLHVWSMHSTQPVQTYSDHVAAVKAIAWSPHHHGLLASGGGTADRCIRFWNTLTGQGMQCVDTGSQVCNLAWSKHSSELVSTHGYSQNQILLWKYPSLTQVAKLTGHSLRVLYLAMSPCGESIVTGAGDETLRFWNVFSKARSPKVARSALDPFANLR